MPQASPVSVRALSWWTVVLLLSAFATYQSFHHVDVDVARYMLRYSGALNTLGHHLGGTVIMAAEALVILTLALMRLIRGTLPELGKVLALACLSSVCAYGINSTVLKPAFGVLSTADVMNGAIHCLHWWQGSPDSSFPSGHMTLAGAFAGVFMCTYPRSIWPLSLLLGCGAVLLVTGNWHFISDVIAGTFAGVTAGLMAGQIWRSHMQEK